MKGTLRKANTLIEPSLTDSELRYRRLFEAAQDGILILDAKTGMIEDVNPYLIKMLGYSRAEFIKKKLWEVGAFKDIEASKEAFEALQDNEYIRYEDLPLKAKDGRLIQVEFVSNVYLVGDETVIQCSIRDNTEHRRIIAALTHTEKTYHDLINQSLDGFFVIESSGKILTVNKAICKALEFSKEELLSMNIWDIIPEHYLDQYRKRLEKILSGKSLNEEAEYIVQGKDGEAHYVEILSAPHYSGKDIVGFQGIARDITARKRAEEVLQSSENRYRTLIAHLPTVVYTNTVGDASSTVYVSPQIETLLGYTPQEWMADPKLWSETIHPDDRQQVLIQADQTDQSNKPFKMEYRMIARDGRLVWVFDQVVLVNDLEGKPQYWQGIMLNITERKQAEEALQESKLMTERIMDTIPVRVFWKDKNLVYLGCNALFARDAGFTDPKDIIGKDDYQMGWHDQAELYRDDDRQVIESGRSKLLVEEPQTTPEGKNVTLLTSKVPLRSSKGEIIGVLGSYMDITEHKQSQAARYESERRFRDVQENIDLIAVMLDRDGRVTFCNDYLLNLTGHSRASVLGQDWFELFVPPESDFKDDFLAEIQQGIIIAHRENEILTSSGERRLISWNNIILKDAEGHITGTNSIGEDITERRQVGEKIERHIAELEALYQSGIAFNQTFDQRDIGEKLIEVLSFHLDWHHAAVRVRLVDSEDLKLVAYMQPDEMQDGNLRMESAVAHVGEGLAGWVIQNEKPLRINNLKEDPRYITTFDGMNSGLYVPLRTYDRTIGCVSVESDQLNAFTKEDEHLLITLAIQAAVSMRNAELFEGMQKELAQRKLAEEKIRRQVKKLNTISKIDQLILSSYSLELSLSEIVAQTTIELGVDAASILIFNSSSQMLESGAENGFRTKAAREAQVRLGESYAGRVALERHLVQIPNIRDEPDNLLLTTLLKGEDFVCYYGLPLIAKGKIVGVLEVFHRSALEPDEEWFDFFYVIARQIAIAIENISLFNDVQRSNSELMLAYETTLEGWSRALDLRDKETEGHTQRVTEMAVSLARDFGLSKAELVDVRRGGLLHDIGKMGVPDHILLKPGQLTEEEWEKMRMHPVYAYDLLSHIAYLRGALNIPHYHHEKWDGSGYPDGLKGVQIPLAARIFAVVDVWDALISDRPYRPAWTKEKAREYVRTSSGTHFDPQVVDMFLKLLDQI